MRMLHGSPGRLAVILENQHVTEALVVFQIQHAIPVGPQHVLHGLLRQLRQRRLVLRRFNHHFVSPNPVHLVEQAFALAVDFAFNSQRRETIRNHANVPASGVRSAAVSSINQNFRWSFGFVTRAEWTIHRGFGKHTVPHKIHWPLSAIRGNNHPSTSNGILTQLRQVAPSTLLLLPYTAKGGPTNPVLYRVWIKIELVRED